jgi:prepilin-type N-terminal cleavage/methylation domain-containing protein
MNKQKGFTIIELIVVIAIIAVLAGIVLVNVTSYINKGKDAAIKGNLAGFMTSAAAHYDTYGSYESLAASSTWPAVSAALAAAGSTGTGAVVIGCDAGGAACTSSST